MRRGEEGGRGKEGEANRGRGEEGEEGMERGREEGNVRDKGERWSEETGDGDGEGGTCKPGKLLDY